MLPMPRVFAGRFAITDHAFPNAWTIPILALSFATTTSTGAITMKTDPALTFTYRESASKSAIKPQRHFARGSLKRFARFSSRSLLI
jgi:hypothetical protein